MFGGNEALPRVPRETGESFPLPPVSPHELPFSQDVPLYFLEEFVPGRARIDPQVLVQRVQPEEVVVRLPGRWGRAAASSRRRT